MVCEELGRSDDYVYSKNKMTATMEIVAIWSMPKVVGCWSSVEGMGAARLTSPFLLNTVGSDYFLTHL